MRKDLYTDDEYRKQYHRCHYWLRYHYGRPQLCESDSCEGWSKIYDWALKANKEHEKKRENYLRLCRSCHARYDWNESKMRRPFLVTKKEASKEKIRPGYCRPIYKIKPNGMKIKYPSITEAVTENGVGVSAIWIIANGLNKFNRKGETYEYA